MCYFNGGACGADPSQLSRVFGTHSHPKQNENFLTSNSFPVYQG